MQVVTSASLILSLHILSKVEPGVLTLKHAWLATLSPSPPSVSTSLTCAGQVQLSQPAS